MRNSHDEVLKYLSSFQPFKVLATEAITGKALEADIYNAIPTEKVDGTCCYVTTYKGNKEDLYADFLCWLEALFYFVFTFIV